MKSRTIVIILLTFMSVFLFEQSFGQKFMYSRAAWYSIKRTMPLNYDVRSGVKFPFGSPSACPPVVGYSFVSSNDTFYVNAFFSIAGAWPHFQCVRLDTVAVQVTSGTRYITATTNEIAADSLGQPDTLFAARDSTFIIGPTSVPTLSKQFRVFPTQGNGNFMVEANNSLPYRIQIFDQHGRSVFSRTDVTGTGNNYELGTILSDGVYLVCISSGEKVERYRISVAR